MFSTRVGVMPLQKLNTYQDTLMTEYFTLSKRCICCIGQGMKFEITFGANNYTPENTVPLTQMCHYLKTHQHYPVHCPMQVYLTIDSLFDTSRAISIS